MRLTPLLFALLASGALADWRPLETTDQARQRQSAENYNTYRANGNQPPLGGYNRPLGDPEVRGVERPGYVTPQPIYNPTPSSQPAYGDPWPNAPRRY